MQLVGRWPRRRIGEHQELEPISVAALGVTAGVRCGGIVADSPPASHSCS